MSQNIEKNTNEVNEEVVKNPRIWKFNGFEVEFDVTDVDNSEKYEKTFEIMGEKEKGLPTTGKHSEILKAQFEWIAETFDRLFGEGSSKKIFGERKSVALGLEAYESFLAFIRGQKTSMQDTKQRISSSYSNRAQRRAVAKKGK